MSDEQDAKEFREEKLAEAIELWKGLNIPNLEDQFGPGTYGQMEAADRLYIQAETVYEYGLTHPAVLLKEEAYQKVYEAQKLLYDAYQLLACDEPELNN